MMAVTTKKGGAKKPATKKPAVKKAPAKPATPKLLKTARTVSCYRYPDDTAAKRRGVLRPWDSKTARPRIGTKDRPVQTTWRNARRGQYQGSVGGRRGAPWSR